MGWFTSKNPYVNDIGLEANVIDIRKKEIRFKVTKPIK